MGETVLNGCPLTTTGNINAARNISSEAHDVYEKPFLISAIQLVFLDVTHLLVTHAILLIIPY